MICLKCSREYLPETEYCDQCNFLLTGEKKYGSHFMQLVRASEEMLNDEITAPLYQVVIENMERIIDKMETAIEEEYSAPDLKETPPEVKKVLDQVLASSRESITTYRLALLELKKYIEDEDKEHIRNGLPLAEKASDLLELSREMSEYAASRLEEFGREALN
ncbi:MAG: hypothetical protein M1536_02790 [Firmicutes bacterium]|nr:hypothetical protein [Bacillota bacterium]